jgi:ParB family transcriptional regulator, chromosome partitioning protein
MIVSNNPKKSVLGRGFAALVPDQVDSEVLLGNAERIVNIDIIKISPSANQPRTVFDDGELAELAASIKQHGILQPIVVSPDGEGYRIIAGERRYRASKLLKLDSVPSIVRTYQEIEQLEVAITENIQRAQLNAVDLAESLSRLRDEFGMGVPELAKKLGKAETTIINTLRLLSAETEVLQALKNQQLSEGHVRPLLGLEKDLQLKMLANIIAKKLSVRQVEELTQKHKNPIAAKIKKQSQKTQELDLQKRLGVKSVKINPKTRTITLKVASDDALNALLKKISLN